jgi:hypothetical protein
MSDKSSKPPSPRSRAQSGSPRQQPIDEVLVADDDNLAAHDDDVDSAYGEDAAESTASLSSSVLAYRTVHGRTYHSERGNAHYWGANDELQNESMDMNHHVLTLALGGALYLAPLQKDIEKAVDIGTGTGVWAIDFADEHPNCKVVGTDVSLIQPSWVPPNLEL